VLEEEYQPRRVLPPHLRQAPPQEPPFSYVIRDATEQDLPSVREIYNYYVTNSTVTFDEKRMSLPQWRSKFQWLQKLKMPFLVAESANNGDLLGYALVQPWKQKAGYRYTVEDSIYLGPAATSKGLGRALLGALIERSREAGLREIIAMIADQGAEPSIALHKSFGFAETGRMGRVGFKFGRWLGIVMLQLSLKKRGG